MLLNESNIWNKQNIEAAILHLILERQDNQALQSPPLKILSPVYFLFKFNMNRYTMI